MSKILTEIFSGKLLDKLSILEIKLNNGKRFEIKSKINKILDSGLEKVKQYTKY